MRHDYCREFRKLARLDCQKKGITPKVTVRRDSETSPNVFLVTIEGETQQIQACCFDEAVGKALSKLADRA